jgi:hypothetical protein
LAILDVETPGRQGVKTQENPNIAAQQVDYFLNGSQWGLHKKPSLNCWAKILKRFVIWLIGEVAADTNRS